MVDVLQIVLVMVATAVTVLTVLIGIQVFNILKEVRESIRKFNGIIEQVSEATSSVVKPITSVADLLTGAAGAGGILGLILDRWLKKKEPEDEEEE